MSLYKRRHFLQFAGSSIAMWGLGQLSLESQGLFDTKAVAQSTPRKLALLVGINNYSNGIPQLQGCVNDVLLQKQLLTYRFGFFPQDILTLTDEQATRKGILQAFEEHLIKQAKPGDIVVFHFSGFGSQVIDADKDNSDGLVSSLLPADSKALSEQSSPNIIQDITGHTLWLLMAALKTENVTFVFDTNSSGGLFNNALKSSSQDKFKSSPEEISYQRIWLRRLNLSQKEFLQRRRKGIPKGVVLAASKRDQLVIDANFGDFKTGAFSYEFTQYLWKDGSQPLGQVFTSVAQNAKALGIKFGIVQEAVLFVKPGSDNENLPAYFTKLQAPGGEGIVTSVQGNNATIWLGGASAEQLETFKSGAVLEIIDNEGKKLGQLQLESRQGLVGKAKLIQIESSTSLKPGLLLKTQPTK
jgi:Caspase domain